MYLSHYKLFEKPFRISADPKYLWLGEKHKEALAILKYGVLERKGFLLLCGDVGTGKTTLINSLIRDLDDKTIVANVSGPELGLLEFLNFIAHACKLDKTFKTKLEFLINFRNHLQNLHSGGKNFVLIIDEAHKLSEKLLEEIRLLSNIELPEIKLLNIFFVGQNEILQKLMSPACRALRQRITISHKIEPLTQNETEEYIRHRLGIAGARKQIFEPKAMREVYRFSKGYPRLINIVCDHALVTGYARDLESITPAVIKECSKELSLAAGTLPIEVAKEQRDEREKPSHAKVAALGFALLLVAFFTYPLITFGYTRFFQNIAAYYGHSLDKVRSLIWHSEGSAPELTQSEGRATRQRVADKSAQAVGSTTETRAVETKEQSESSLIGPNEQPNAQGVEFLPVKVVIPFDYDANDLPRESYETMDKLAKSMLDNHRVGAAIVGYTDNLGDHGYNRKLSEFRANSVKIYLVGKGVDPSRIQAVGKGGENPLVPNTTAAARKANRRVEVELRALGTQ